MRSCRYRVIACLIALVAAASSCAAEAGSADAPRLETLSPIAAADRVMVLAPHEDDEAISTAGVIQQAVAAGAPVRVVYLTYGDHNEWAFMAYRMEPLVTPSISRTMGERRREESIRAMALLGLKREDLAFLGYPDYDTLAIWERHWGSAPALYSLLTNAARVPYRDALASGRPHKGESILGDVEEQIREFRPTRLFVSHPADANPDHRAFYLYAQGALWDLAGSIPQPEVLAYPTHFGPWPQPRGYRPDETLSVPPRVAESPGQWRTVELTPEQVRRKEEAILTYKTQVSVGKGFLTAFARRNEIFCTPAEVRLAPPGASMQHVHASPTPQTQAYEEEASTGGIEKAVFEESEEGLLVHVALRGILRRYVGLSLYAFGYRSDRSFGGMPKLAVSWSLGMVRARDQSRPIRAGKVKVERTGPTATFTIPWEMLGDPQKVFVAVQGAAADIPPSQTGWHVLVREAQKPGH